MFESLTILERAKKNCTIYNPNNFDIWFNKKNILNEENKKEMITYQYGFSNFLYGIGELNSKKYKEDSYNYSWNQQFNEILKNYINYPYSGYDMSYTFRFLSNYIEKTTIDLCKDNNSFLFNKSFIESCVESYNAQIKLLIHKIIIYEMHKYKKVNGLKGNNGQERFENYIKTNFTNISDLKSLYYSYPFLIRHIMQRTIYFKKNISDLIERLNQDFLSFIYTYNLGTNTIETISLSDGDTHDKGRSVSTITFSNNQKIVYKPKDLTITKSLAAFFNYLNKNFQTNILIPKRFIKNNYIFEEYIEKKDIKYEREASNYYYNYGQLVAIAYILNGSDFHFENIIAHGSQPVLIDLETVFQEPVPLKLSNEQNPITSVLATAMLPFDFFPNKEKKIDMSGLTKGNMSAPIKTKQLSNIGTDSMKYEDKDIYIPNGKNLPELKGKVFLYNHFQNEIYNGFSSLLNSIIENKSKVNSFIDTHFQNLYVRIVLRPTMKYKELLDYSYHPIAMYNAIERERLLQNLWAYPFKFNSIIKFEYNDLLKGDIPLFLLNTSKTSLFNSEKKEIRNVFDMPPIKLVQEKINKLDTKEIERQLDLIKKSFT